MLLAGAVVVVAAQCLAATGASAATFPGVNGKIYYANGGMSAIGAMNMDGTSPASVKSAVTDSVAVSPDGTKIAYGAPFGSSQIHVANIDGSNDVTLTSGGSPGYYNPSWSPDGTKLIFWGGGSSQIYSIRADGTNMTQLTNEGSDNKYPTYSPDGTKIAYQRTATGNGVDIWVMNADGTNKVDISNTTAHEREPRWSPDGTKILYSKFIDNTFTYDIWRMNADGSSQAALVTRAGQDAFGTYTPDGTKIIFLGDGSFGVGYLLYTANLDGSNVAQLNGSTRVSYADVRPLTLTPAASTNSPSITVSNGTAAINIPALYTDPYGGGIDASSVAITAQPTSGTATVNASGVITYTQQVASRGRPSWLGQVARAFFPKASAASTDSFGYRVCSSTSSSLCTTGTVSVVLAASTTTASTTAPRTGAGQPQAQFLVPALLYGLGVLPVAVYLLRRKRSL